MTLSEARSRDRRYALLTLVVLAVVLAICLSLSAISMSGSRPAGYSGAVLFPQAQTLAPERIEIATSDETYTLTRNGLGWNIPEKAGFAVDPEKIEQMLSAMSSARFTFARTSLPARFDELGLGAPDTGGTGALVKTSDSAGMGVIIGLKNDLTYGRRENEDQTYRVDQTFPALHSASWWLDFDGLGLDRDAEIRSVRIEYPSDQSQPGYFIEESAELTADARALLIASEQLEILDVADASTLNGAAPYNVLTIHYEDDASLTIRLYRRGNAVWSGFSGDALSAPELAEGRIFRLDPISASELVP